MTLDPTLFPGMLNCPNTRFTDVEKLSTEQMLFDGYWNELINLYGVKLEWQVCRYDKEKADNLYGEHINQPYADPVTILGLVNLQENAVALSKYGFVTDDTITLYLHITTYTNTFTPLNIYQTCNQKYIAPKAGDIFTMSEFGKTRPLGLGGKMFKVTDATDQDVGANINQLAGHYVWVIQAKRYDPSYEPNVSEENESYQIFDDPHTGRIVDGVELKELPSEQKQYDYDVQEDSLTNTFDYIETQINTNIYGGYLKQFTINNLHKMPWYATTENIQTYSLQPTTDLIDGAYYQCVMQPEYGNDKQGIKIPSIYILTKVEIYNKIENTWEPIGGDDIYSTTLFTPTKTSIEIDGENYDYTQFQYNGPIVGKRSMKFYVTTSVPWFATIKGDGTVSQLTSGFIDGQYYTCILAGETAQNKQTIQIPSQCVLDHVEIYNIITHEWSTIAGSKEYSVSLFTPEEIVIQINNKSYNYTQYTYNGTTVGSREMRFYVNVVSSTTNLPGSLPWYATSQNILTFTEQDSAQFVNDSYFECEMQPETSTFKQAIQIPAQYNIAYVMFYNTLSAKWCYINSEDYSLDLFTITNITKSINGQIVDYKQYTHNGPQTGQRDLRFYVQR